MRNLLRRPTVRCHVVVAVCALALAVTYRWTWALWEPRTVGVPNVPIFGWLDQVHVGPLLVASCLVMIGAPRLGSAAHLLVFVVGVLGDQVRIEPEFISLTMLAVMIAWSDTRGPRLARGVLGVMWFWAGCNKALSAGWPVQAGPFINNALHLAPNSWLVLWGVPVGEMVLGLSTMWRRLRYATAIGGVALHVGIFITLGPFVANTNSAVWPWNIALAIAVPVLFVRNDSATLNVSRPSLSGIRRLLPSDRVVAGVIGLVAVVPVGFYFGVTDAYLSHNVYTSNTSQALRCRDGLCREFGPESVAVLNVPAPQEKRIYIGWFRKVCESGEELTVIKPRTRISDQRQWKARC